MKRSNNLTKRTAVPEYLCTGTYRNGQPCRQWRGEGTPHFGIGYCAGHGGYSDRKVWAMAYDVAREEDITPWEALLKSVRRAAGRVTWVDAQLTEVTKRHDGGESSDEVRNWLKESRNERLLLGRMAKAAIDAGVTERMVRQVELEGQLVAEALARALDALNLPHEQRMIALTTAHDWLLHGGEKAKAIEGEVIPNTPMTGGDMGYGIQDTSNDDESNDTEE